MPEYAAHLTKRELFAALDQDTLEGQSPEAIARALGWEVPDGRNARELFLWWRKAEAAWRVAKADALIEALEKGKL